MTTVSAAFVDPWAAAIHVGALSRQPPIGAGVVVDTNLVLTCEHVACHDSRLRDDLWISFPRAAGVGYWERRQVGQCLYNGRPEQNIDLVLLELVEPVPAQVAPARLRCLAPGDLVERSWRAYGYPQHTEGGCAAHGTVRAEGGWGRVHLVPDADSEVTGGFSGAGLWSPDYDAVVGIVVEAARQTGDGHALALAHADQQLPGMKLSTLAAWRAEDTDDPALAAWGWRLSTDDESRRHWMPRARGVAANAEGGSRFRGRTAALRSIVGWLEQPRTAGRPLIVTGSPGVGKSAVLGRIVTTADASVRAALAPDDVAERAAVGLVGCAVHAKGKTALEAATEIARAAGVALPAAPVDLVPALRGRFSGGYRRFNLIVDALDEAATPHQARVLARDVLVPLARTGPSTGVQVVVGTRRSDDLGDLLAELGPDAEVVDLDAPAFFAETDLADYARATLRLLGAERPGNPYEHERVAGPVARRIATLANGNFLIAGLVARTRALRDTEPVAPDQVAFTATVANVLDTYLEGLPPAGAAPARLALTVLAYAETPGLPITLWRTAIEAFGARVSDAELTVFARTSAANFLVETGGTADPAYRLFHQALNEALLASRDEVTSRAQDERRLVDVWLACGAAAGWEAAPDYLLRALPNHAARAGRVDELLGDDGFLLHVHLDRLLRVAERAAGPRARARVQLLLRTPAAIRERPAERAALFSVVDRIDRLDAGLAAAGAPYLASWANTPRRTERTVLEGHTQAVHAVCPVVVDRRPLLASAGEDGTVRLWDPLTNQNEYVLSCHDDCIRGMCAVGGGETSLIATCSHDGTVALWDPITGHRMHELLGHGDWVRDLCAVSTPVGPMLASAGDDGTVRVWDPATGAMVHAMHGHRGWATAVTALPVAGGALLASTGFDGTIRFWDPGTGAQTHCVTGEFGRVTSLCPVQTPAGARLAAGGYDGVVRLWNPATGDAVGEFALWSGPVTGLCTVEVDGACLLVATGEDGIVRLWDSATGLQHGGMRGHADWIRAVCEIAVNDRRLIATAGDDGTVRLWDPAGAGSEPVADVGCPGAVSALCTVPVNGRPLVASAGSDGTVRLWTPTDGTQQGQASAVGAAVNDMCLVDDEGPLLAVATEDGAVEVWDLATGTPVYRMGDHFGAVNAVSAVPTGTGLGAGTTMASAGVDVTIRLWNPHNGAIRGGLTGHGNWVTALAVVVGDGAATIASGDTSGTIRLWEPSGTPAWVRPAHHDAVNDLCTIVVNGTTVLVSAGADRTITLWRCGDGRRLATFTGHTAAVTGVCPVVAGGREILASTSLDRTVRLWDPQTARAVRTIPVHHRALSCCYVDGTLVLGLDRGLLGLELP